MTPVSSSLPAMLDSALSLSQLGHAVFPLHTAIGERCSCRQSKCPNPGKHPRTKNGLKDATTDAEQIRRWWTATPDAGIGLRTGNGLLVVDIDPGRGGEDSMTQLLAVNGSLPETPESVTGSGGRHIYFQVDTEVRNSVNAVGAGIDIRGDGGFVVAPPSVHATGRSYEWASGRSVGDLPLANVPQWLLTLCVRRPGPSAPTQIPSRVIEGGRNEFLFKQACGLRGKAFPEEVILSAMLGLNATKCHPPLDEVEVRQIVAKVVKSYQEGYFSGQVRPDGTPDRAGRIVAGAEPTTAPNDSDWEMELVYDHKQRVDAGVPGNAMLLIANLEEWRGCLQFDEFANRIHWVRRTPEIAGMPSPFGEISDEHILFVQQWLAKYRGVKFVKTAVQDALIAAGKSNRINPLQSYLRSIQWDGTRRVVGWPSTYLGVVDDQINQEKVKLGGLTYSQAIGKWWMVSAVARALTPGCQADHMLILEGDQGCGKSTTARILGGDWFLGSLPDLSNKDRAADAIRGFFIVEVGELDALRGVAGTKVKDWLTQPSDTYRAAYDRFKATHLRSCVFIGTTNEFNYMRDATGGRRYWPMKIRGLDRAALIRDRDQLWAEAVALFDSGEQWHPTPELAEEIKRQQEARYEADPWEEWIYDWLNDPSVEHGQVLTSKTIALQCLRLDASKFGQYESQRIGRCMRRLGYNNDDTGGKDGSGAVAKNARLWVKSQDHSLRG